jgi:hypothetical protein
MDRVFYWYLIGFGVNFLHTMISILKGSSADGYDVEGDILLYDVDELLECHGIEKDSSLLPFG